MTWEELKRKVEIAGLTDVDRIIGIEFHCDSATVGPVDVVVVRCRNGDVVIHISETAIDDL